MTSNLDLSSLCINMGSIITAFTITDNQPPILCQILMKFIKIINNTGGSGPFVPAKIFFLRGNIYFQACFLQREAPKNPPVRSWTFGNTIPPPPPHPQIICIQQQSCLWPICKSTIVMPRWISINVAWRSPIFDFGQFLSHNVKRSHAWEPTTATQLHLLVLPALHTTAMVLQRRQQHGGQDDSILSAKLIRIAPETSSF